MSILEIVFVGQCEVFVCLDFVNFFFFPRPKNVDFSDTYPLKIAFSGFIA